MHLNGQLSTKLRKPRYSRGGGPPFSQSTIKNINLLNSPVFSLVGHRSSPLGFGRCCWVVMVDRWVCMHLVHSMQMNCHTQGILMRRSCRERGLTTIKRPERTPRCCLLASYKKLGSFPLHQPQLQARFISSPFPPKPFIPGFFVPLIFTLFAMVRCDFLVASASMPAFLDRHNIS